MEIIINYERKVKELKLENKDEDATIQYLMKFLNISKSMAIREMNGLS